MHRYKAWNTPMATTAAIAPSLSGTSIKTLLQIATPSTRMLEVISWGYSCNGNPGGTIELVQTNVAATVTAHVAAGVQPMDPNIPASLMTLGTAATGYNATAEGSITATRSLDTQYVEIASQPYEFQFMPDERPRIAISSFLRVRITAGTTTGILCWICWDE
jgi:hypothetical protein